jgi:hypothetical protein
MRLEGAHRPLLRVAAVTAGLASGAAHAAEWVFTPNVSASAQTQSNPSLQPDEKSKDETATSLATTAAFGVTRESERLSLTMQPNFSFYRYPDSNQLDRNEQHLDSSVRWRGETSTWSGAVVVARDTTLTSELGNTGITQGNQRHEFYDVQLGPAWQLTERWSTQVSVDSSVNRYPGVANALLEDYRYDSVGLGTSYVLSERATVSFSGSVARLHNLEQGQDSKNASAMVTAQYAWSPVWNMNLGVGPSVVRLNGTSEHGLVYRASLSRGFERSSLALTASRSQQPSGSAIITNIQLASLAFSTALTERVSGAVNASYTRRGNVFRDFNVDLSRVTYTRLEATLAWHVSPSWQIGGGVGNSIQKTGSFFFDDRTGRGYDVRLSLSWNGKPYVH